MREINYRGKQIETGEWLYGDLVNVEGNKVIVESMETSNDYGDGTDLYATYWAVVNPETIGQYTGLKDKNGTEIYEGDVVDTIDGAGKVIYEDLLCAFAIEYKVSKIDFIHYVTQENATLEVIGNTFDGKELLV